MVFISYKYGHSCSESELRVDFVPPGEGDFEFRPSPRFCVRSLLVTPLLFFLSRSERSIDQKNQKSRRKGEAERTSGTTSPLPGGDHDARVDGRRQAQDREESEGKLASVSS